MNKKLIISILTLFLIFLLIFFMTLYPTKNITKYIVKTNQDYFVNGINKNKYINLYYDFLIQNFFKNNFQKEKKISQITKETKKFLFDQQELSFYLPKEKINLRNGNFSLGSIIIYGYGWCESINGVLAVRLSKDYKDDLQLFSLFDSNKNISPHTLIKINKNNSEYYVDIWGLQREIIYTFDKMAFLNEPHIKEYNKYYYPNYYLSENNFKDGFILKKFSTLEYFKSLLKKFKLFNSFIALNSDKINFNLYLAKKSALQISKEELINIYIDARFEHIINGYSEARKYYERIANSNCSYDFCKISKGLILKDLKT